MKKIVLISVCSLLLLNTSFGQTLDRLTATTGLPGLPTACFVDFTTPAPNSKTCSPQESDIAPDPIFLSSFQGLQKVVQVKINRNASSIAETNVTGRIDSNQGLIVQHNCESVGVYQFNLHYGRKVVNGRMENEPMSLDLGQYTTIRYIFGTENNFNKATLIYLFTETPGLGIAPYSISRNLTPANGCVFPSSGGGHCDFALDDFTLQRTNNTGQKETLRLRNDSDQIARYLNFMMISNSPDESVKLALKEIQLLP